MNIESLERYLPIDSLNFYILTLNIISIEVKVYVLPRLKTLFPSG